MSSLESSSRSGSRTSGRRTCSGITAATASGAVRSSKWFLFDALDAGIAADTRRQRVRRLALGRTRRGSSRTWSRCAARRISESWAPCERPVHGSSRTAPAQSRAARRAAAAADARRRRRPGAPRRPGQAAAQAGRAGPSDQRDLLGPTGHRQDHAGPGRRRQHQACVRADERGQRRRQGCTRGDRAGAAANRRARSRHDPVPRRDPQVQQVAAGRAAAGGRGRHADDDRRDDREPVLRGQPTAAQPQHPVPPRAARPRRNRDSGPTRARGRRHDRQRRGHRAPRRPCRWRRAPGVDRTRGRLCPGRSRTRSN